MELCLLHPPLVFAYTGPVSPAAAGGKCAFNPIDVYPNGYIVYGGQVNSSYTPVATVDAYNSSMVHSNPTALSVARQVPAVSGLAGGSYLFAGGQDADYNYSAVVDAYNSSLTRSTPTALTQGGNQLTGCCAGNYAIFEGQYATNVDAYNSSYTKSTTTRVSTSNTEASADCGSGSSKVAVFMGGDNGGTAQDQAHMFNQSLVHTSLSLGYAACYPGQGAAIPGSNLCVFAGGASAPSGGTYYTTASAFNTSGTRTTGGTLRNGVSQIAAFSLAQRAVFVGGRNDSSSFANVDSYDSTLVRTTLSNIPTAESNLSGGTNGVYGMVCGYSSGAAYGWAWQYK